ncbi:MAG: hypothetical protein JSV04_05380 [Candidatus Heimdallarchaeota archaeon]|nr:MAG: hypothetical protein JSV04_05380 [Candidatus Heimdallarchaeota archaeon]
MTKSILNEEYIKGLIDTISLIEETIFELKEQNETEYIKKKLSDIIHGAEAKFGSDKTSWEYWRGVRDITRLARSQWERVRNYGYLVEFLLIAQFIFTTMIEVEVPTRVREWSLPDDIKEKAMEDAFKDIPVWLYGKETFDTEERIKALEKVQENLIELLKEPRKKYTEPHN